MTPAHVLNTLQAVNSNGGRWLGLAIYACGVIGAAAVIQVVPSAKMHILALLIYVSGVMGLWVSWLGNLPLLARTAARQCMPGVASAAAVTTVAVALLCIAVPLLAAIALGSHTAMAVQVPALVLMAVLATYLWPKWLASIQWYLLSLLCIALLKAWVVYSTLQPWLWAMLVMAVFASVVAWRQLTTGRDTWMSSENTLSRLNAVAGLNVDTIDRYMVMNKKGNGTEAIDLRGVGPKNVCKSLGVALGRSFLPLTWRAHMQRAIKVALPLFLMVCFALLVAAWGHGRFIKFTLKDVGDTLQLGIAIGGAWIVFAVALSQVLLRWQRPTEMAVLALLPGIGGKRASMPLRRVLWRGPLLAFAALAASLSLLAVWTRPDALMQALVYLAGMAVFTMLSVDRALVGSRMAFMEPMLLAVLTTVLSSIDIATASSSEPQLGVLQRALWLPLLWQGLIVLGVIRLVMAQRALSAQAHPFLVRMS